MPSCAQLSLLDALQTGLIDRDRARSNLVKLAMEGNPVQLRADGSVFRAHLVRPPRPGPATAALVRRALQPGVATVDTSMLLQTVPLFDVARQFHPEMRRRRRRTLQLWVGTTAGPAPNRLATALFGDYVYGVVHGTALLTVDMA